MGSLALYLSTPILLTLLFLAVLTTIGIIILRTVTKEDRFFTLSAAGMVCGIALYIFLLNIASKMFPGRDGIGIATITFIFFGIYLLLKYRTRWESLKFPNLTLLILSVSLILVSANFSRLKMTTMLPAADSDMQWAYAGSFIKGNSPPKIPWQPDLDARYHMGAYFFEGALVHLSGLPFITAHTLINIFFLISGLLLAMFILWETKYYLRNLWLATAALVMFVAFGVIIIVYPNHNLIFNFFKTSNFESLLVPPENIPAKGIAGAALVDLDSLSFLPARSLSLGLSLLALYFSTLVWKNVTVKIISYSVLLSVVALVEESAFLPLFLVATSVFILSLLSFIPNLEYLKQYRKSLLAILILTSLLVVLQGGFITNNLFTQKESVFNITLPTTQSSFFTKIKMLDNLSITQNGQSFNWFLPSPIFFIVAMLFYSYFKKSKVLALLGLFSIMSFVSYLSIEYKYSPTNNIRFYNYGSIATGSGLIYLLFLILRQQSNMKNLISAAILFIFMFFPTLIPELIKHHYKINEGKKNNIMTHVLVSSNSPSPSEEISTWAGQNLPTNARLIVIDEGTPTNSRSLQFQYKGIYTIYGPQYIHTTRPEPGIEFFDLILTLNPSLLKQSHVEYIYIESRSIAYQQLPKFRKEELSNNKYFDVLQSIETKDGMGKDAFYRLYKVKPNFLDPNIGGKDIEDGTLLKLQQLIPNEGSIYIADYGDPPKLNFWYRMATVLALKDKDIRRNLSQTDYQAIEINIPYKSGTLNEQHDFYVLAPNEKPPFPSKLIWSSLYASAWER